MSAGLYPNLPRSRDPHSLTVTRTKMTRASCAWAQGLGVSSSPEPSMRGCQPASPRLALQLGMPDISQHVNPNEERSSVG